MPSAASLVGLEDVETSLVRPLTSTEEQHVIGLCDQASAKLRGALRTVDDRIAAFEADSSASSGIDPAVVAAVLADVVARRPLNPRRVWSTGGESAGPFSSPSETFPGSRGGSSESFGSLTITDDDLAQILASGVSDFVMPGTIRTRPLPRGC